MKNKGASLVLTLALVALGMGCNAQDLDFSGYRPDPGERDRYVAYHLKPLDMKKPSYHESVMFLASVLGRSRGVIPGASGYYLNRSKFSPDGVRLTLFLKDGDQGKAAQDWVEGLVRDRLVKLVPYVPALPEAADMKKSYGGDEREFRKFLCLYTPILVQCLARDRARTEAEFQSLADHGGMDVEVLELSPYFMAMSGEDRTGFVGDLYSSRKWMHMAINFVLGHDVE